MNCLQCNAPLEDQARFCRNCGSPVAINSPKVPITSDNPPTVPTPMPRSDPVSQEHGQSPLTLPAAPEWNQVAQTRPAAPPSSYAPQEQWMPEGQPVPSQCMPPAAIQPGSMQSLGTSPGAATPAQRKRKWP